MKRLILAVAVLAVAATPALAIGPRSSQISVDQLAPSRALFDTTIVTSSSSLDTLNFGFVPDWVSGEAYDYGDSCQWYNDWHLPASIKFGPGLDSTWTSNVGKRKGMPYIDQDKWWLPASASFFYPSKASAIIVKGMGTGTTRITAGVGTPNPR